MSGLAHEESLITIAASHRVSLPDPFASTNRSSSTAGIGGRFAIGTGPHSTFLSDSSFPTRSYLAHPSQTSSPSSSHSSTAGLHVNEDAYHQQPLLLPPSGAKGLYILSEASVANADTAAALVSASTRTTDAADATWTSSTPPIPATNIPNRAALPTAIATPTTAANSLALPEQPPAPAAAEPLLPPPPPPILLTLPGPKPAAVLLEHSPSPSSQLINGSSVSPIIPITTTTATSITTSTATARNILPLQPPRRTSSLRSPSRNFSSTTPLPAQGLPPPPPHRPPPRSPADKGWDDSSATSATSNVPLNSNHHILADNFLKPNRKSNRWSGSTTSSTRSKLSNSHHSRSASVDTAILFEDSDSHDTTTYEPRSTPQRQRQHLHLQIHQHKRAGTASSISELGVVAEASAVIDFGETPDLGLSSLSLLPTTNPDPSQDPPATRQSSVTDGRGISGSIAESHAQPSMQAMRPGSSSSYRNQYGQERDQYSSRGPPRTRDGSGSRGPRPPSQKAMLSKALQKANTAVQLDNAQNFEGARQAYVEACDLLRQVLQKTSQEEDKRKLEAIRRTYLSRIEELDQMEPQPHSSDNKALPARPDSDNYSASSAIAGEPVQFDMEQPRQHTQALNRIVRGDSRSPNPGGLAPSPHLQTNGAGFAYGQGQPGSSRSPLSAHSGHSTQLGHSPLGDFNHLQSSFSKSPNPRKSPLEGSSSQFRGDTYQLRPAQHGQRTESPQRSQSLGLNDSFDSDYSLSSETRTESRQTRGHGRANSQNSWLDPITESGGSRGSSVHSRTSSHGYRRRHLRGRSGDTENEFDTALDEAIEAAYNDGYEPMGPEEYDDYDEPEDDIVAAALRKVELARERVRQTEQEAFEMLTQKNEQHQRQTDSRNRSRQDFFDESSSGDEEHILEEMNRNDHIEDYTIGQQRKPRIPRASDSSGTTSRTWHSSQGSNPPTGSTSLSTVAESSPYHSVSKQTAPPPMQSLPEIPTQRPGSAAQSVRSRRLSGQNPKQLKIETAKLDPKRSKASTHDSLGQIVSAPIQGHEAEPMPSDTPWSDDGVRRPLSPPEDLSADSRRLESPFRRRRTTHDEDEDRSASPSIHKLRKNFSSSSLRGMKARNMSLTNLEESSDMSPVTPSLSRVPTVPALPTSATFRERVEASATGGLHLFEDDFHSIDEPGSPNSLNFDSPVSLEPCPQDFMLRPFWLMRCLYQTLANPRGGYLSTKLFIPREAWKVKGVKLKNVEDKIANCDFLTAALLKLATVDTYDADAVLEEMQSLEGILEQAQAALTRKLGSEVGVQSSSTLFKDASGVGDGDSASGVPRSASVSTKTSSFSWRRLRTQKSAAGLGGSYNSKITGGEAKDNLSIPSLPMVPAPTSKSARRDISQVQFTGPNANYMGSLARLFDAAQVIDQIARQVDDPGLRHADKTQVGLELCTRHAAEFFAFYVCRFVLTDITLLLDKFIKRGSEWVLA